MPSGSARTLSIAVITAAAMAAPSVAGTIRHDRADSLYQSLSLDPKYNAVGGVTYTFGLAVATGTLITPKWVLTAGHVVDDTSTHRFYVGGTHYNTGLQFTANLLVKNPGWNSNDILAGNDIGLMRLSQAVTNITPASRFTGTEVGNIATTVGFGETGTGLTGATTFDGIKRAGNNTIDALGSAYGGTASDSFVIADFDDPNNADGKNPFGSAAPLDLEYCAGPGDSGGPSFIGVGTRSYVAGVTSFLEALDPPAGDSTDDATYSDTYAVTRVAQFNQWIDDNITIGWKNAASGSFATAANWIGSATPTTGDVAGFNAFGTFTVTFSGNVVNHRLLARAGNVTLNLNGSVYTLDSNTYEGGIVVGKYPGNNATINVANGSLISRDAIVAEMPGSTGAIVLNSGATWNALGTIYLGGSWQSPGGSAALTVNSGSSLTAYTVRMFGGGTFNGTGGSASMNSVSGNGALNISGNGRATINPDGTAAGVCSVASLSISGAGALDLNDNDLVVDYSGPSPFTTLRSYVFAGFSFVVDPTKTGIVSSTSQNSGGKTILALFDNALVGAGDWPPGSGITIDATAVVGKYTYFGDMNLDRQVTGDDYVAIDSNLNTTPPAGIAWLRGDANLDGIVTGDDYAVIDSNLGNGVGNPLASAAIAIPEPGCGLLLLALPLVPRRLRNRAIRVCRVRRI